MAFVSLLLLLLGTFSFIEAGVGGEPPAVQLRTCLPQLMSEVAVRVNLRGRGQYCPNAGQVDSPLMAFVRNRLSAVELNPSCSILDLALESCTAVGRRGQRTAARFSANLTCNDPCEEAPDSKEELLNSATQQRQRLRAAVLSARKIKVSASFLGRPVSIAFSKGKDTSSKEVCRRPARPRQGVAIDSDATLCMCPEDCPEVCELPPVTGPCRAAFRRWFHNSTSGQCEPFTYGGCGGNENNFETLEECQRQCSPQPECPEGKEFLSCGSPCPDTCENRLEFSRICPTVCVPGCFCPRGQVELDGKCVPPSDCPLEEGSCSLSPEPGLCDGDFRRWFYNSSSEFCQPFSYGGCGGNSNNFPDPFECLEKCRECPPPKIFRGCGTACPDTCDNRLEIVRICTLQCVPDCFCPPGLVQQGDGCIPPSECPIEEGACELPLDVGPCRGTFTRWFYNTSSGQCERFTYGGCQGNDNNFQSLEDCQAQCAAEPQPGECSGGKVFTTCGSACPLTCANMADPPSCIAVCVEGCFCPRGTVEYQGNCLAPRDCPALKR